MNGERPLPLADEGADLLRASQKASQRQRLINAVGLVLSEHGYSRITVGRIVAAAHVSRRTFYENFESPNAALIAAHDTIADWLLGAVLRRAAEAESWEEKVRGGLHATLEFSRDEPHLARLLVLDLFGYDPALARRTYATRERFAELLRPGRELASPSRSLPECTELFLVCGVTAVVGRRLLTAESCSAPELVDELTRIISLPYQV